MYALAAVLLSLLLVGALPVAQTPPSPYTPAPGVPCGVVGLAFCETFDQPAAVSGRAGDLNPARWTAGRNAPQQVGGNDAWGVDVAPVPPCRASVPVTGVYPDQDALVCDTGQLMTAVAFQTYGLLSLRARQPFDFAGRTGRIVFDVDAVSLSTGSSWISLDVTADPVQGPNSLIAGEHAQVPPEGLALNFNNDQCVAGVRGIREIFTYHNYVETDVPPMLSPVCVAVAPGRLNHIEVRLSQTRVDVYASDASPDGGQTFPNFQQIAGANINLAFSRGYIHLGSHNHATLKYYGLPDWVYHWDNVGFDGPVLAPAHEYDIPDALTTPSPNRVSVGYKLRDASGPNGPGTYTCCDSAGLWTRLAPFTLPGVDLTNATRARLTLLAFYCHSCVVNPDLLSFTLQYRFNGGTWHSRTMTQAEATFINTPGLDDNIIQVVDVPLADLITGTNTLEFATLNTPQNYPPVIGSITLVVDAGGGPVLTPTPVPSATATLVPTNTRTPIPATPTVLPVPTVTPAPTGPQCALVGIGNNSLIWTPQAPTSCPQ